MIDKCCNKWAVLPTACDVPSYTARCCKPTANCCQVDGMSLAVMESPTKTHLWCDYQATTIPASWQGTSAVGLYSRVQHSSSESSGRGLRQPLTAQPVGAYWGLAVISAPEGRETHLITCVVCFRRMLASPPKRRVLVPRAAERPAPGATAARQRGSTIPRGLLESEAPFGSSEAA